VSALIAPANAADMPVPAPPPADIWTGWYIGANAGYAVSTNSSVQSVGIPNNCSDVLSPGCAGIPGFIPLNVFGNASAQAATFSTPSGREGNWLAGGQFGYNHKYDRTTQDGTKLSFVVGLEADLQAMGNNNHSFTFTSLTPVVAFPANPIAQTATLSRRIDWLGTVRARGGYLWMPEFLLYITAGLAYAETELNSSITQTVIGGAPSYTAVGTSQTVRFGATIGAGFEWMLAKEWSVRGEYLYVGLDNNGRASANPSLINTDRILGGNLSSVNVLTSTRFNENIARAALNYHFPVSTTASGTPTPERIE